MTVSIVVYTLVDFRQPEYNTIHLIWRSIKNNCAEWSYDTVLPAKGDYDYQFAPEEPRSLADCYSFYFYDVENQKLSDMECEKAVQEKMLPKKVTTTPITTVTTTTTTTTTRAIASIDTKQKTTIMFSTSPKTTAKLISPKILSVSKPTTTSEISTAKITTKSTTIAFTRNQKTSLTTYIPTPEATKAITSTIKMTTLSAAETSKTTSVPLMSKSPTDTYIQSDRVIPDVINPVDTSLVIDNLISTIDILNSAVSPEVIQPDFEQTSLIENDRKPMTADDMEALFYRDDYANPEESFNNNFDFDTPVVSATIVLPGLVMPDVEVNAETLKCSRPCGTIGKCEITKNEERCACPNRYQFFLNLNECFKKIDRRCRNGDLKYEKDGVKCTCKGLMQYDTMKKRCTKNRRPKRMTYWSAWQECSATCDEGVEIRQRICVVSGTNDCDATESRPCNITSCLNVQRYLRGKKWKGRRWSKWSTWTKCSKPCGGGMKSRR